VDPRRIGIVVVRPLLPSNLGSIARACKNFGVLDLRLVEPAAQINEDSHRLASGAGDVLEGLRRYSSLPPAIADFEAVVATSSLRGRGKHRAISLGDLPGFLQELGQSRVALVFGPEKSGLTEEEMSHASVFLRLPTEPEFPTLNVSHAVAITLAAARLAGADGPAGGGEPWAAAKDIEGAIEHWDRALDAIGFYDTGHHDRTLRDWRRIVAGRPLPERDVKILRGIANRILVSLRRRTEPGNGKRKT
jgi:TrmH family RNA methyltransferase